MASKEGLRRPKLIARYQDVFGGESGRAVLVDLMKGNFVRNSTFNENPYVTAYQEGRRDTILRILTVLKIDHQKMLKEIEKQEEMEERDGG